MYILDTDHLSIADQDTIEGFNLSRRLATVSPGQVSVTIVAAPFCVILLIIPRVRNAYALNCCAVRRGLRFGQMQQNAQNLGQAVNAAAAHNSGRSANRRASLSYRNNYSQERLGEHFIAKVREHFRPKHSYIRASK